MVKNLHRLASLFDLDQSECKSPHASASAHKAWPIGVTSRPKFSTCIYCESVFQGLREDFHYCGSDIHCTHNLDRFGNEVCFREGEWLKFIFNTITL